MAVIPWVEAVRSRRVLRVFPTAKVAGEWLRVFQLAIVEFNRLSNSLGLGVTLASSSTRPDPVGEDGAEVQFDLGNGRLEYEAFKTKFVAKDDTGQPISFSPFDVHGSTQKVISGGIRRAFIFVPETPQVEVKKLKRPAGSGIKLFIAVHEFVHACGLSNSEHNFQGPNADVFTIGASVSPGEFGKPEDDKFLLQSNHPNPPVFGPPITIKKKVADLIRANWS